MPTAPIRQAPKEADWGGTGVALVTPFEADGSLDLAALRRVVAHVTAGGVDKGVDFLVPMGTTGESATLTEQEVSLCMEVIVEENAGRLPVLMGCGGNNTAAVAQKMELYAHRFPLDGFMSVVPYYNKPTQAGLYAHFHHLAERSPLPLVLYNIPGRSAVNLLPETVGRLANDCPTIIGIKEASGGLEQGMAIQALVPKQFAVICGDDGLALPALSAGFVGVISVAANAYPQAIARMVRLGLAGKFTEARDIHNQLLRLIEPLFAEGNPAGVKAALSHLGICQPHVRLPLVSASAVLERRLEVVQKALDLSAAF
jgi:4-hydroxy-tetrahydrodipicolinate synthase